MLVRSDYGYNSFRGAKILGINQSKKKILSLRWYTSIGANIKGPYKLLDKEDVLADYEEVTFLTGSQSQIFTKTLHIRKKTLDIADKCIA